MDELGDLLSRLRSAWMSGGGAQKHCPPEWLPFIGDGPQAELALAAIAGQALQAVFRPAPGGPLTSRELLPPLALPPAPDALRPRLRRLIGAHSAMLPRLLVFLASRGVTMHPADWLPAKRAEAIPALYAPWIDWVNGGEAPSKRVAKSPELDVPALAAELAEMLEIGTVGLLRRRRRLAIRKLDNATRSARRLELFALVPLSALAAALRVTPSELVQTAPAGAEPGLSAFASMVAASGAPEERRNLLAAMLEDAECPLMGARPLAASLDRREAAALLPAVLRRETAPGFPLALALAGEALGLAEWPAIAAAPGYAQLREYLVAPERDRAAETALGVGLTALGLLASAPAAKSLIDACLQAGLSPADPKLDALALNAALNSEVSA
jgi:hypothetical protein